MSDICLNIQNEVVLNFEGKKSGKYLTFCQGYQSEFSRERLCSVQGRGGVGERGGGARARAHNLHIHKM